MASATHTLDEAICSGVRVESEGLERAAPECEPLLKDRDAVARVDQVIEPTQTVNQSPYDLNED